MSTSHAEPGRSSKKPNEFRDLTREEFVNALEIVLAETESLKGILCNLDAGENHKVHEQVRVLMTARKADFDAWIFDPSLDLDNPTNREKIRHLRYRILVLRGLAVQALKWLEDNKRAA